MAKRRKSAEQIIRLLKQAEVLSGQGKTMEEICRTHGMSDSTCYKWCEEYGGMGIDQVKRLRELEKENNRFKRLVTDLSPDVQIMKEVLLGNS